MGKQVQRLKSAIQKSLATKQDVPKYIAGLLGIFKDGAKVVKVPNRPGYVYVRVAGNESEIIEAVNGVVPSTFNTKVLVTMTEANPGIYVIVGRDLGQYTSYTDPGAFIPKHGASHSFGNGSDPVFIYRRQMVQPLQPRPTNPRTMTIYVEPDFFLWNGVFQYWHGGNSPNLNTAKPTDPIMARYVTIYLEGSSNTLQVVTGTDFPIYPFAATGTLYYVPEVSDTLGIPLAAVILTTGTSAIQWTDIKDVRMFLGGGNSTSVGGFTSGSVPFANGSGVLTEDNDDFFWDNANKRLYLGTNYFPYSIFNATLQVVKQNTPAGLTVSAIYTGTVTAPFLTFFASKGTLANPLPIPSGTNIGRINATAQILNGYGIVPGFISGVPISPPITIEFKATENWNSLGYGNRISFQVTPTGSITKAEAFGINPDNIEIVGKKLRLTGDMWLNPTGAVNGDYLRYDGTYWKPNTGSSGGSGGSSTHSIISTTHSDTNTGSVPIENDILAYHTGTWMAESPVDIGSNDANILAINFLIETGTALTPASGHRLLFAKTDGMYTKDSSGLEIGPFGTGTADASITAGDVTVIDGGGYYSGGDVESVLQEIGSEIEDIVQGHEHGITRLNVTGSTSIVSLFDYVYMLEFVSFNGFILDPLAYSLSTGSNSLVFDTPLNTDGILTANYIILSV